MDSFEFILKLIERVSGPSKKATGAMKGVERQMKAVDKTAKMVGRSQGIVANSMKKVTLNASQMGRAIKQASAIQAKAARQTKNSARMDRGKQAFGSASQLSMASSAATSTGRGMLSSLVPFIQEASSFEQAMANVKSLTTDTTASFTQQTAAARKLGKTTVFTAQEAAGAMSKLAMAGFEAKDQIAALPAVLDLAVAGQTDLARTAEISSNIMGAFGVKAGEMRGAADVLAATFSNSNTTLETLGETMKYVGPVAKAVGLDLSDVAKFTAVLGNAGIDASMAGTALRTTIAALSAPTALASKTLRSLGISAKDANGNLVSPLDTLMKMNDALAGKGSADKMAAVKGIFGKFASSSVVEILDKLKDTPPGVKGYKELAAAIDDAAGSAGRIAEIQSNTAQGRMLKMKSALSDAAITIGNSLLPVIEQLVPEVIKMAEAMGKYAKDNPGTIAGIAKTVAVLGGLAMTVGAVASTVATLSLAWGSALWAWGATASVVSGIGTAFTVVGTVLAGIVAAVGAVPLAIGAAVVGSGIALYAFADDIGAYLNSAATWWAELGTNMGNALVEGIKGPLDWVLKMAARISSLGSSIGQGLTSGLSGVTEFLNGGATALASSVTPSRPSSSGSAPRIAPGSLATAMGAQSSGGKNQSTLRQNVELNLTISGADTSDAQSIARAVNEQMSSMLRSEHAMAGG